jgi:hypothetical protein
MLPVVVEIAHDSGGPSCYPRFIGLVSDASFALDAHTHPCPEVSPPGSIVAKDNQIDKVITAIMHTDDLSTGYSMCWYSG